MTTSVDVVHLKKESKTMINQIQDKKTGRIYFEVNAYDSKQAKIRVIRKRFHSLIEAQHFCEKYWFLLVNSKRH
jgi:hypothetical protein